jgi:hypothetical protein
LSHLERAGFYAKSRNHFKPDKEFDEKWEFLIQAYEEAAERANGSARCAMRFGDLGYICRDQWDEAVAMTIEACLEMAAFGVEIGDTSFFEQPSFEIVRR